MVNRNLGLRKYSTRMVIRNVISPPRMMLRTIIGSEL